MSTPVNIASNGNDSSNYINGGGGREWWRRRGDDDQDDREIRQLRQQVRQLQQLYMELLMQLLGLELGQEDECFGGQGIGFGAGPVLPPGLPQEQGNGIQEGFDGSAALDTSNLSQLQGQAAGIQNHIFWPPRRNDDEQDDREIEQLEQEVQQLEQAIQRLEEEIQQIEEEQDGCGCGDGVNPYGGGSPGSPFALQGPQRNLEQGGNFLLA